MPLETEIQTYNEMKESLLKDEGKYAVIFGRELLGIASSYEEAMDIGYGKCGLAPFLARKIQAKQPVIFIPLPPPRAAA